ncbi:type III glutamate--ammonia ligase [Methylobacterium bullatum]|uniref:Glutamate--methylamine ligase n=1 Tax=Methylobacterium bullatum TaxID=570505 RepID=A0AAV4ZB04_9HYPH|nr:type III glutamate--ammonia ligase [Methylobacterium bullatum]MBD8904671.1 type III glutamate--ammonia ligase [Methylobacterium bullatum]GJD40724.1 Glutamate--methylamine ligase [Methylobacterium bullatum]
MAHATEIDPAIAKLQDDLRAKGVKYVIGAYVDIHGAQKAKVVPVDHLPQMAAGSERYTGYALDGLGQAPNEDELASVPDFSQLIQLPWESKLAWCPADLTFQGQPYPLSTRVALKSVLKDAEAMGFGFNLGIECEIFLLKQEADGSLHTPIPDDKLVKPCYDVRGFVDNFTWLDKVATTINDLGWDLYSFDHEDACGQFEFDFNYADALTMCDRLTFFRMMAKQYAKEEGLIATMMPKPFADRTGNGAHFNMSLSDKETGKNAFACDPKDDPRGLGLTETGYHFIGGVLKHGRALCAAFAPTVNSYKRLVRQGSMAGFSWAPVFNSYGSNNRTNSVRVPAGGGRCESRNADGAVNPYLAAALVLAAGLEGVRERIDPGAPNEDNLYDLTDAQRAERGIEFLPQTLAEAVDAFAADPLVEKTLGKALRDEFIRYKRAEWEEYHLTVSAWEIERYSHLF